MGRTAGVLVCAFMTFGTIAAGSPAELKGWRLALTDDFERALVGPHWQPLSGMWSIDKGRLTGNGQILCAWRFPGPQRLEYDARSRDPSVVVDHKVCDLSVILATGRRSKSRRLVRSASRVKSWAADATKLHSPPPGIK